MLYPIIPNTSLKVLSVFNVKEKEIFFESIKNDDFLNKINKISKIDILFKKINND